MGYCILKRATQLQQQKMERTTNMIDHGGGACQPNENYYLHGWYPFLFVFAILLLVVFTSIAAAE